MLDFIKQYKNAKKVVSQIKAGEWVPRYNNISNTHHKAERNELALWIGNGAWFCEIEGGNYFGIFWRHYVWWAAARKLKKDADRPYRKEKVVLL